MAHSRFPSWSFSWRVAPLTPRRIKVSKLSMRRSWQTSWQTLKVGPIFMCFHNALSLSNLLAIHAENDSGRLGIKKSNFQNFWRNPYGCWKLVQFHIDILPVFLKYSNKSIRGFKSTVLSSFTYRHLFVVYVRFMKIEITFLQKFVSFNCQL